MKFNGKWQAIHTLVLLAFVGPCPEGMECRHLDGTRTNCALANLCWGTRAENVADQRRHGVFNWGDKYGESHHNAQMTDEVAREIGLYFMQGGDPKYLARLSSLSTQTFGKIKRGWTWTHLFSEEDLAKMRNAEVMKDKPLTEAEGGALLSFFGSLKAGEQQPATKPEAAPAPK